MTNHAYMTGEAQIFPLKQGLTKLQKFMTILGIFGRCSDSYLKISDHFKLNANASNGMKLFNKALSYVSTISNVISPLSNSIAGSWEAIQTVRKMIELENQFQNLRGNNHDKTFISRDHDRMDNPTSQI